MSTVPAANAWGRGRFDARDGAGKILFGRMYEDTSIELDTFPSGGRVFCIASAGCTAMALASRHEVVAVDINPVQLAYAERRIAGENGERGAAERFMAVGRAFAPLVGWRQSRVREFLDLENPREQTRYWRRHLDTRRFRAAVDGLLSVSTLRTVYAAPFLDFLPARLGEVFRGRMARCFERHANRENPYARALLLGEMSSTSPRVERHGIRLVHSDAAGFLEQQPAGCFDGFSLSNILDGADSAYARRLYGAVKRAGAPGAMMVLRSFREPRQDSPHNRAAEDRSMLWGIVDVRPVASLTEQPETTIP
jgi:S-adenosylmethionine:diacylglycerol 3-amino-3-carboxypropyl transferase